MSILQSVKDFVKTYPSLDASAPVQVDHAGSTPPWYTFSVVPVDPVIDEDITGRQTKQFVFTFNSVRYTADELERLESNAFFEGFSNWLKSQTDVGALPTLDTGLTPLKIEATTWGFLFEEGASETGIYQVTCRLEYQE